MGIPQVWSNVGRLLLSKLIRNVPTKREMEEVEVKVEVGSSGEREEGEEGGGSTVLHCSLTFTFQSSPLSVLKSHPSAKHNPLSAPAAAFVSLLFHSFLLLLLRLLPNHLTWHFPAAKNDVVTENFIALIARLQMGGKTPRGGNLLQSRLHADLQLYSEVCVPQCSASEDYALKLLWGTVWPVSLAPPVAKETSICSMCLKPDRTTLTPSDWHNKQQTGHEHPLQINTRICSTVDSTDLKRYFTFIGELNVGCTLSMERARPLIHMPWLHLCCIPALSINLWLYETRPMRKC